MRLMPCREMRGAARSGRQGVSTSLSVSGSLSEVERYSDHTGGCLAREVALSVRRPPWRLPSRDQGSRGIRSYERSTRGLTPIIHCVSTHTTTPCCAEAGVALAHERRLAAAPRPVVRATPPHVFSIEPARSETLSRFECRRWTESASGERQRDRSRCQASSSG